MGRGTLTKEEIKELKKNPYVEEIKGNQIRYSEEFKIHFLDEYYAGKKPMEIFIDAGFDISILGNKRIERCSSRWRESNASGNLGVPHEENKFYKDTQNFIHKLKKRNYELEEENISLHNQVELLKKQLADIKL